MKTTTALVAAFAALGTLLPCAAPAAELPELVYARFHGGAVSGNVEQMLSAAPEAKRAEFKALTNAQRDASIKAIAAILPGSYTFKSRQIVGDSRLARVVFNTRRDNSDGGPEALYGVITLVMERGEWKVSQVKWGDDTLNIVPPVRTEQPAAKAAPKAAAPPAAQAQTAPAKSDAPVVGSTSAAPMRKLGTAKPPCVFKPVMTPEDLENCR